MWFFYPEKLLHGIGGGVKTPCIIIPVIEQKILTIIFFLTIRNAPMLSFYLKEEGMADKKPIQVPVF